MNIKQVGAQLYSIRDYTGTISDLAKALKRIREIGYEIVQVSKMGHLDAAEIKKALDDEGLRCVVTHETVDLLVDSPDKAIERLKALDCQYTAYPHHPGGFISLEDATGLVATLTKIGTKLSKAGITLLYHNHNSEFMKFKGKTVLDILYDETPADILQGEIDTYWVQAGGCSPVDWCEKLANRLPILHIKDLGMKDGHQQVMREIGYGNLNWKKIIQAAEASGTQWYLVEHDTNWFNDDPFKSLKMSFDFIKENLCS